jgi:hypothetical protein
MTHPAAAAALQTEFNDFLFAPIGKNSNGMQVSVLSGLAQADLDPWQEAAELARLPAKTAIERLARLIGSLPERGWAYPDAVAVATRLIALLPRGIAVKSASTDMSRGLDAMANSRSWWIYIVLMSVVFGSQVLMASRQMAPKTDKVEVRASNATAPQAPPQASVGDQ